MASIYSNFNWFESDENSLSGSKANLKNIFVSPYPTLFYRYGSVGRIFLTSQIGYPLNLIVS